MEFTEFRQRYQYDPKKDLLGVGGFGRVYRAQDSLLNRRVALKVFSHNVPQQYDLISEIRRAIDLNHPNICRYYGAEVLRSTNPLGESQEIQVGIMQYVEGGTIDDFLRRNPQHRKKLLTDVLRGLSYLHQHQPSIIHRDLKPSNVLVGFEDGVPIARITDFGISKSASLSGAGVSVVGLGTFAYMAPEQLNPARYGVNGKIQCNLDLWSFGVMTVELLTGTLPFSASNPEASTGEIFEAIVRGLPPETLNRIEEPYRGILKRCMVQEASKRVQNAAELLPLLDGVEEQQDKSHDQKCSASARQQQSTRSTVAEEKPHQKTIAETVKKPTVLSPTVSPPTARQRRPFMAVTTLVVGLLLLLGVAGSVMAIGSTSNWGFPMTFALFLLTVSGGTILILWLVRKIQN